MAAIAIAIAYLSISLAVLMLPPSTRSGIWLPLHLALAGGASTAIAGVLPFFSAALAAAPPADARVRWASVLAVALGAAIVTLGFTAGANQVAVGGGGLFVMGIVLVGVAAVRPLNVGLGPRGGLVMSAYLAALVMVVAGVSLAILFLVGWPPAVAAWATLKPAHAWLNLVGFVSLVIAATLLHLFPTVVGARIPRTRVATVTVLGLAAGNPLVALSLLIGSDTLAVAGAAVIAIGASALAIYGVVVWRERARWTTAAGWHRFAMGGLASAIGWFVLGIAIAVAGIMHAGAGPLAFSTQLLIGPLVLGWMGLAVLASATHLVPSVGPGDAATHAHQRRLLGTAGVARIIIADIGIAAVTLGSAAGLDSVVRAGLIIAAATLGVTVALILIAVITGTKSVRRSASGA